MIWARSLIAFGALSVARETIVDVKSIIVTTWGVLVAARILMGTHVFSILVIDLLINQIILVQDDLVLFDSGNFLINLG